MLEGYVTDEKKQGLFYLCQEEKVRSRKLYEKVFLEDSVRFVDYYYTYKVKDNRILVLLKNGEIVSMLHRNPYTMIVNGYEVSVDYIVAVATREDCRHQGYMRSLLERALQDMNAAEIPFAFLMPASESIYAPFDFVWICPYTNLPPRVMRMDAEAQNYYLASHYQMFCKRDARYMENLKAQQEAEAGEEIPDKMPPFMARITDVCQMLQLISGSREQILHLRVRDSVIQQNDGYYCWKVSSDCSKVVRMLKCPEKIDMDLTIGELTSLIFSGFDICLSEIV